MCNCGTNNVWESADGRQMCRSCAVADVAVIISRLSAPAAGKLRRRVEDVLRKSPRSLVAVASGLVVDGQIRIDDL